MTTDGCHTQFGQLADRVAVPCEADLVFCNAGGALSRAPLLDRDAVPCEADLVFCGDSGISLAPILDTQLPLPANASIVFCGPTGLTRGTLITAADRDLVMAQGYTGMVNEVVLSTGSTTLQFDPNNSYDINQGGNYNTGTGLYTAPRTGLYRLNTELNYRIRSQNEGFNNIELTALFLRNNTIAIAKHIVIFMDNSQGDIERVLPLQWVGALQASDTVEVRVNLLAVPTNSFVVTLFFINGDNQNVEGSSLGIQEL